MLNKPHGNCHHAIYRVSVSDLEYIYIYIPEIGNVDTSIQCIVVDLPFRYVTYFALYNKPFAHTQKSGKWSVMSVSILVLDMSDTN